MSKTMSTRHWALRKIEQAKGNLNWFGGHIHEVSETYSENHPEIAEPLNQVKEVLVMLEKILDKVKDLL